MSLKLLCFGEQRFLCRVVGKLRVEDKDVTDEEIIVERNNRAKAEKNRTTLSRELEDQLISGGVGFCLSECWGATPAVIESCLRVADFHDVIVSKL